MARVLVGMSGGVDSSVAALLLKEKGYEVIGVTMDMWRKPELVETAVTDAKKVCEKLGIEYHVLDFSEIFKNKVMDYFVNEYINGRTPNPCNACNRFVKFEALQDAAKNKFNCDYIATGHYARIGYKEETGRYFLRKSVTDKKDQTYALYNLTQEQLKSTIMPLGDYTKEEIREIAEKNNLINAKRRDSQEICFIPDNDYAKFICEKYNYKPKAGNFVDTKGNILGQHKGIIYYTIGQRKGLEIAFQKRMYVIDIDVEKNEVILGDDSDLFRDSLICDNVNLMLIESLNSPLQAKVKVRYSAPPCEATLIPIGDGKIEVRFSVTQRAITKGQSAVFYEDDILIGGGTIC